MPLVLTSRGLRDAALEITFGVSAGRWAAASAESPLEPARSIRARFDLSFIASLLSPLARTDGATLEPLRSFRGGFALTRIAALQSAAAHRPAQTPLEIDT